MFDEQIEIDDETPYVPSFDGEIETETRPSRLVGNLLIRPEGTGQVSISWTSDSEGARSWIFLNGKIAIGPFMAETKERTVVLPVPSEKTFKIEIHDFYGDDVTPNSIEEPPLVKPPISWNAVSSAVAYRIYHTIFDTGSIESLLLQVPPLSMERMEVDCPVTLEGRGGRWHSFRVETVDQFGNESENEIVPHFAVDLPKPPELTISRDTATGLLTFRIH